MALEDLDMLRYSMPDLFDDLRVPTRWEDDWVVVPADEIEGMLTDAPMAQEYSFQDAMSSGGTRIPVFDDSPFPGSPVPRDPSMTVPPPDCLAFYLPFHYYHPDWWGVYLVAEPMADMVFFILANSGGALDVSESLRVARTFAYSHEVFHHQTECFATRLEISHRMPLYRTGFHQFYEERAGTEDSIEEALASAYAYNRVDSQLFKGSSHRAQRLAARKALSAYIETCPPGYDQAMRYVGQSRFGIARDEFAEDNHRNALPQMPFVQPGVWRSAPHAFTGMSRVNSAVNYVVHRDSPLMERIRERGYYLSYREVESYLRRLGFTPTRQRGSHQIWQGPDGRTVTVPRHRGDMASGTVRSILKSVGVDVPQSQLAAALG
ncbi:MAG: type II toxin-antitoxin system HicA family toxin [Armatimonadetes bacterium]|nr:type II toxin-antitoxin system HicA family toxin [Armatimonadota bacterium]